MFLLMLRDYRITGDLTTRKHQGKHLCPIKQRVRSGGLNHLVDLTNPTRITNAHPTAREDVSAFAHQALALPIPNGIGEDSEEREHETCGEEQACIHTVWFPFFFPGYYFIAFFPTARLAIEIPYFGDEVKRGHPIPPCYDDTHGAVAAQKNRP